MDSADFSDVKEFCKSFLNPVIFFNKDWEIVYCNKKNFITTEKTVYQLTLNDTGILNLNRSNFVMVKGKQYCARAFGYREFYVAELFSYDDVFDMAVNVNIYEKILPFIGCFEYNIAILLGTVTSLKKRLKSEERYEDLKSFASIEKSSMQLSAASKNIFQYANMFYLKTKHERINTYALVEGIINRCNQALVDIGRRIEFISQIDDYSISANQSHCITALINAIQNALLYSPVDCDPTVIVTKTLIQEKEYAVIMVKNRCRVRSENDEKTPDLNFSNQRIGCGIPIIKRFAEESGGIFDMEEDKGIMTVTLKIPMIVKNKSSEIVFGEDFYSYYDTGIPDIIDLKMFEVIEFFSNN